MSFSDFDKLKLTVAGSRPFPHILCPAFVQPDKLAGIQDSFPTVPGPGSFPLSTLKCGNAFQQMVDEISSPQMLDILAEKLRVPITTKNLTMVTVRGYCRPTDGKIHIDSDGKLITVLLYLNTKWDEHSGYLRLLNNSEDLEDYFMEVPPYNGTLLAFRCDKNAWHGHKSFCGERKVIQLNWVVNEAYRQREVVRHFFSAAIKKVRTAILGTRTSY